MVSAKAASGMTNKADSCIKPIFCNFAGYLLKSRQSGIEKAVVQTVVEAFMENVKGSMIAGNDVFLRGFGSFIIKRRAEKTARNISKNTTIKIPAHNIPAFKPAKSFVNAVKENK